MINYLLSIKKWLLLSVLICCSVCFFYFRLYNFLDFATLKYYQATWSAWTALHYPAAVGFYLLLFTALIACGIPCATILCLLGGMLFGETAIAYALLGTTLGGILLFSAVKMAVGSQFEVRSRGWLKTMEGGFQKNAFNYILMLRLVPIFPCWLSNIGAGMLNVPAKTFIAATLLGILPATIIYVLAGRSLDKLLLADQTAVLNIVFTPSVFLPLLGLAILSLFPVIYKNVKNK